MLAAKLQEMEEKEDEEVMDENIYEAEEEEVEAEEEEEVEAEEGEEAEEEGAEEKEGNEEEELEIEDMSVEDLKELIRDIVAQETGNDETEEELPGEEAPEGEDLTSMDSEEEIDINELLAELDEMDNSKNKMKEYSSGKVDPMPMFSGKETGKELDTQLINAVKSAAKKAGMSVADFYKKYIAETPGEPMMQRESEELNEALKAVKILRNQLQEVNLLNAKLLYVNKVFKSTNLSEGQKVNVIAAFDKAETVKEVKLVFETVSKNVVTKPAALKEHRSFASKATGNAQTTAPKEILSEVSDQVSRWQKLAGIIK
jgi:hypothetical protein